MDYSKLTRNQSGLLILFIYIVMFAIGFI